MSSNMIIDIGCETIDFSKVERVGSIYGEPGRYDVYFASGGRTIILVDCDSVGTNKMKREDFISKWKAVMRKYYNIKKSNNKNKEKDENENT